MPIEVVNTLLAKYVNMCRISIVYVFCLSLIIDSVTSKMSNSYTIVTGMLKSDFKLDKNQIYQI